MTRETARRVDHRSRARLHYVHRRVPDVRRAEDRRGPGQCRLDRGRPGAHKGPTLPMRRPGATLAAYKKVRLGRFLPSARTPWVKPPGNDSARDQQQRIKDQLATLIREETTKQLTGRL